MLQDALSLRRVNHFGREVELSLGYERLRIELRTLRATAFLKLLSHWNRAEMTHCLFKTVLAQSLVHFVWTRETFLLLWIGLLVSLCEVELSHRVITVIDPQLD